MGKWFRFTFLGWFCLCFSFSAFCVEHNENGNDSLNEPVAAHHWRFDRFYRTELIGPSFIYDLQGDRKGLIAGPVQLMATPSSLLFNGESNRVILAATDSNSKYLANPFFTVEAWVYLTAKSQRGAILGYQNLEGKEDWWLGYSNFRFTFHLNLAGASHELLSKNSFLTEKWYFVTAVFDGSTMKIYIDGVHVRQKKLDELYDGTIRTPNTIGGYFDRTVKQGCFLSGRISEIRLYDQVLKEDGIASRYDEEKEVYTKPADISFGPYLQFTSSSSAVIRWETEKPVSTVLEYGKKSPSQNRIEDATPKINHEVHHSLGNRNSTSLLFDQGWKDFICRWG